MKLLSFSLCFITINPSFALDFEKAWKDDKFQDIKGHIGPWIVHPEKVPSVSLYYDEYNSHHAESSDSRENNSSGAQWTSKHDHDRMIEITLGNCSSG